MDFEKREHRPWKTELLESTIIESAADPADNLFLVKTENKTIDITTTEALERAEQAELSRHAEEHSRIAAENRMREAIEQVHKINQEVQQLELDNKTLDSTISELFAKNSALEQQLTELSTQIKKLESIIESERELRALAENRAKRAVDQANSTIMQLLNTPNYKESQPEKIKIRIPAD